MLSTLFISQAGAVCTECFSDEDPHIIFPTDSKNNQCSQIIKDAFSKKFNTDVYTLIEIVDINTLKKCIIDSGIANKNFINNAQKKKITIISTHGKLEGDFRDLVTIQLGGKIGHYKKNYHTNFQIIDKFYIVKDNRLEILKTFDLMKKD